MKTTKFILFIIFMTFTFSSCGKSAADTGYDIIGSYAKEKYKKNGWGLNGIGGNYGDHINKMFLSFECTEEVNIERARLLVVEGIEGLLKKVNANLEVEKFISHPPLTYKEIEFDLMFVSNEGGFAQGEHIASVGLVNGKLFYAIDSKDKLVTVYKEPYEEALKIVNSQMPPVEQTEIK